MAQTILIPTDFSIDSIQVLREYLANNNTQNKLQVVFAAGYDTGNSITTLLFHSRSKIMKKMNLDSFNEALHIIENKYSNILNGIRIEFFSGWNNAAFQNFLTGNHIDHIVYTSDMRLQSPCNEWFDLTPFIKKTRTAQTAIPLHITTEIPKEFNSLSPLFSKLS